jgi:hypothetical protein
MACCFTKEYSPHSGQSSQLISDAKRQQEMLGFLPVRQTAILFPKSDYLLGDDSDGIL